MSDTSNHDGNETPVAPGKRRGLGVEDYVAGVLAGDRTILSRAITLIESGARAHQAMAEEVVQRLLPRSGKARRIGITGVPGVGKSTFIEAFGCELTALGRTVAVLAIDPSSQRSGGSILGDKTRMEKLSREARAFIRPSPAGDNLGGVARRTRETMLLCEAAGFDTILVETMGVGQAEVALRSMVDFFLLLLLPGAGDELQGIKKGVMEMADLVVINKADGDNRMRAEQARVENDAVLHYLRPATAGWQTRAVLCSARTGQGVAQVWESIGAFYGQLEPRGVIKQRRQEQTLDWLTDVIREELRQRFFGDARVKEKLPELRRALMNGEMTVAKAAAALLKAHEGSI